MKYMRINMENMENELTNTALEIAKRLEIEVNEDFVRVIDMIDFEDWVKESDVSFIVMYEVHGNKDNYFSFDIDRKHMQYNFDKDIMYGFFEYAGSCVRVNGSQDNKEHWDIVGDCVEIHNELNYKNKTLIEKNILPMF